MVDFFFFQAEDGIRDDLVTGVQTCALPIFEVLGCKRTPVVRPEGPEFLGSDGKADYFGPNRFDGAAHGQRLGRKAAHDREELDGAAVQVDLVHQPFLSEIISSTSSESFARRSSSLAMTGTPRMLMRARRTTNMTESFSTTRLMFATTSTLRSSAVPTPPTPVRKVVVSRFERASNGLRAVGRTSYPRRWRRWKSSRSNPSSRGTGPLSAAGSSTKANGSTGRANDSLKTSSSRIATSRVAAIPSRYIWMVRRETPAISARAPSDKPRSSRIRRKAAASSRT